MINLKLAVYFPGIGYHCDKPLLYYAREAACQCDYEFINISYDTKGINLKDDMEAGFKKLYEQTEEQLKNVDLSRYEDVLFVSKSIGTAVAAAYTNFYKVKCRNVFYTPLEYTFTYEPCNGIAFTGTADSWADFSKIVEKCSKSVIDVTIIENANHSLEVKDCLKNLQNLQMIMEKTLKFIQQGIEILK